MLGPILDNLWMISRESKTRPSRRYIAKSLPNGTERRWGVFDQKAGRYLKNHEVEALTETDIRENV